MKQLQAIQWDGSLILLDQTRLPEQKTYLTLTQPQEVFTAIRDMQVRGAPAIGVAAAYGMVLAARSLARQSPADFMQGLQSAGTYLSSARPTAVNLPWAVSRMLQKAADMPGANPSQILTALESEAILIHEEDLRINKHIGEHLLSLLWDGCGVLTHCNAGALATTGYGTALSPFYLALERGIPLRIYADETRPRLQGASLTAYELHEAGADITLICDNMAAVLMQQGKIDAIITGCDRVAANGDTANKIGTFSVSVLAQHFGLPLYIAAPTPTIDLCCPSGQDIPIEQRSGDEILYIKGKQIAPAGVKTFNPSFDVTPAAHITAIVTEKGIVRPPYGPNLRALFE
ncbi:MAG: S-methyl-5-thioribose-1-phosphate isomerase [Christensenellales bacterium]|jgi:methylthioribose-1-phosphate isomerase